MTTKLMATFKIQTARFRDWLYFDVPTVRTVLAWVGYGAGRVLLSAGRSDRALTILSGLHRAALNDAVDCRIERLFAAAIAQTEGRAPKSLRAALDRFPDRQRADARTQQFHEDPRRLLRGCMLVLKSPSPGERGVLYCYYSYIYPLLIKYFEFDKLTARYSLVLEPSWTGMCDPQILCLYRSPHSVVVGVGEPRDARFLRTIGSTFEPAWFTGNTWVDTEVFRPMPDVDKDIDLVMIAAWARYKRHWAFFRALREVKRRGRTLKVALVGYSIDMTIDEILDQAESYGVREWIEIHERIDQRAVAKVLARSRANVLWSRREGSNRAIIEGMAAGVPCILRRGFNYGFSYPHINERTGVFADDSDLADTILNVLAQLAQFAPRDYVLDHMTPQSSTKEIETTLRRLSTESGEAWTKGIAVKFNSLHALEYSDAHDIQRYEPNHRELESLVRSDAERSDMSTLRSAPQSLPRTIKTRSTTNQTR